MQKVAFILIGLVIRKSRFVHQALSEITPLRDIFATLFTACPNSYLCRRGWGTNSYRRGYKGQAG